jgi:hypothetical protein
MDVMAIQGLERAFWYRLGGGVLVGAVLAVVAAVLLVPDPFLPAFMGVLAVAFLGFAATALAVGDRLEAAGQAVAALGWVVLGVGAAIEWRAGGLADAVGVADPVFWGGIGLVFLGGVVGMWADRRAGADAGEPGPG